jgi:hypothetical protein
MSYEGRLIVTWHDLKRMGWPYSRAHTWRMMEPEILRSSGTRRKWSVRNSPPVWLMKEILAYFEAHDLTPKE